MRLHKQHTMLHNYYFTYANCIFLTLIKRNSFGFNSKLFEIRPRSFRTQILANPTKHRTTRGDKDGTRPGAAATTRQRLSVTGGPA